MSNNKSFITLGRITRPHGIRGDVCAQYYAESFSYLDNGQALIKTEKSAPKPFSVSSWRMQGNILILKLKGVDTRTDAEFLRNYDIVIEESLLVEDTAHEQKSSPTQNQEHNSKAIQANNPHSDNYDSTDNTEENDYDDDDYDDEFDDYSDAPFLHHIIGAKAILQNTHSQSVTDSAKKQEEAPQDNENELGIIEEIIFPAGQEVWVIKNEIGQEILFPAVSHFIDHYDLSNNKVYITPPAGLLDIYLNDTPESNKEPKEKKKRQNAHKNKPLCGEGKKQNKPRPHNNSQSENQNQSKSQDVNKVQNTGKSQDANKTAQTEPQGKNTSEKNASVKNASAKNKPLKNKPTQKNAR